MKPLVQRAEMSLSNLATIYGCCGLFDLCNDQDLMSLSLEGQSRFLDWLGWELTTLCRIRKGFIHWMRPDDCDHDGVVADPCADPTGVEFGVCEFELNDFGRLRLRGPVRDVTMNAVRLCEAQPRYRLDGTRINDDREFDIRVVTEVLLQDLKKIIVSGNKAVSGEFDGLQQLVKTNYTDPEGRRCSSMDSIIVDWNGNSLDGGAGITWNGAAVAATYDFIDVLAAVVRHIIQDIGYAPALSSQNMQVGDMVLVMPTFMTRCLLDAFTCWSVCPSTNYLVAQNTFEARTFRRSLDGGMFGAGKIFIDGLEIPLLAYDWGLTRGPTRGDIYLLTGSVGGVKLLQGQLLDMRPVPGAYPGSTYAYTDGGRLLTWTEQDQTCVRQTVEMRPRLLAWAPWAQARFEDVQCAGPHGPKSPDPCESSFYPETSFEAASCPPA